MNTDVHVNHRTFEPQPKPARSAFARRILAMTDGFKASSEARDQMIDSTKLVFGSKVTWAIAVGALVLGMWVQGKIETVNRVGESQSEILAAVNGMRATLQAVRDDSKDATNERANISARLESLSSDIKREERERRLLQDYVEGRIGKMPYRPQGDQ